MLLSLAVVDIVNSVRVGYARCWTSHAEWEDYMTNLQGRGEKWFGQGLSPARINVARSLLHCIFHGNSDLCMSLC